MLIIKVYPKCYVSIKMLDKKPFERKYKYSTLKYFHDILGIE
jgi:hypothetical protein